MSPARNHREPRPRGRSLTALGALWPCLIAIRNDLHHRSASPTVIRPCRGGCSPSSRGVHGILIASIQRRRFLLSPYTPSRTASTTCHLLSSLPLPQSIPPTAPLNFSTTPAHHNTTTTPHSSPPQHTPSNSHSSKFPTLATPIQRAELVPSPPGLPYLARALVHCYRRDAPSTHRLRLAG